jgi:serine/threonine-protein kinase RsbT
VSATFHLRMPVRADADVAMARVRTRELAAQEGLSAAAIEALTTAVSELARNIVDHAAASGEILLGVCEKDGHRGVIAAAHDDGPGISDPERAMEDGWSSAASMGLGLPSARRLVDEFELVTVVGRGTRITITKLAR